MGASVGALNIGDDPMSEMPQRRPRRRLSAILASDVVGFSKLMATDEQGTHDALKAHREQVFDPCIENFGGRMVKLMGDGALVEFASAVDAVECGIAVQTRMHEVNAASTDPIKIVLRIGINVGDIIIDGDDIYGDGVNVAARLEALATPGNVCVSGAVYDQVRDKISVNFSDMGPQHVKNIDRPVPVYEAVLGGSDAHLRHLEAICEAAGLPAGTLSHGDPLQTAEEIGKTLRVLTEELSELLQQRAAARRNVRSGQVTMIGREDNNPLKFMPTPEQALAAMFGPQRPGFQRGADALRDSFADILDHQKSSQTALKPALNRLLEDLTPEAIEARTAKGGFLSNRAAKSWETFVERWDTKKKSHKNGMHDIFMAFYAEAYDQHSRD